MEAEYKLTAQTTTPYAQLKRKQTDLIRKAFEGSIFIADHSADLPTALISGAGGNLLALPPGYEDIGWVGKGDGATWSRSVDTSEVNSWGAVEPTRTDITKQTNGLKFTAQETKAQDAGAARGTAPRRGHADTTSGEVHFDRLPCPTT